MLQKITTRSLTELKNMADLQINFICKTKKLTEHLKILSYLLNLPEYNVLMNSKKILEDLKTMDISLKGRGLQGERPREIRTKYGFPFLVITQTKR